MKNSVVETGYLGYSPARSMRNVNYQEPFTWIFAVVLVGLVVVSVLVWFPLIAVTAPIALHAVWHGNRSLLD